MTVPAAAPYPRIPCGEASFRRIRVNGWLYVDKTRFLRPLEDERYVFFIRPRHFGKSCWLSLLECYYGRHWAHEFEDLFGDTDVGRAPTAERGRHVILRFDFSAFSDKLETLEERFEGYCLTELRYALERHPDLFPDEARRYILSRPAIDGRLHEVAADAAMADVGECEALYVCAGLDAHVQADRNTTAWLRRIARGGGTATGSAPRSAPMRGPGDVHGRFSSGPSGPLRAGRKRPQDTHIPTDAPARGLLGEKPHRAHASQRRPLDGGAHHPRHRSRLDGMDAAPGAIGRRLQVGAKDASQAP